MLIFDSYNIKWFDFIIYSHLNRWFTNLISLLVNQSIFHNDYILWIRCKIRHLNSAEKWSIILSLSIPIRMKSSNLRSNRQRRKFCQHWKSVYLYLSILYITNWRHSWSVLSFLLFSICTQSSILLSFFANKNQLSHYSTDTRS